MSGAKNATARESCAMRGPSRHTTSRLVAGASGLAATARARSAMTRPSAPSATLDSVSGRPATSCSAGERAIVSLAAMERAQPAEHHAVISVGNLTRAGHPGIDVRVGRVRQVFELGELDVAHVDNAGVGEAVHDQVHLAGAAMPRPVEQPSSTLVQPLA